MPRETISKFGDAIALYATQKAEAGKQRFVSRAEDVEPARQVYVDACTRIAASVAPRGFKYARSTQRATRMMGDFTCVLSFQSSHHNISGQHVSLLMHANVRSKTLQRWREERLPRDLAHDHVAGGMVHLLGDTYAMVEWELADPEEREATIADAISFVNTDVLPFFSLFESPQALVAKLGESGVAAFTFRSSVEFALCFGSADDGQRTMDRFVRERPDLQASIRVAESSELVAHGTSGYAEEVVFLRRKYGLR